MSPKLLNRMSAEGFVLPAAPRFATEQASAVQSLGRALILAVDDAWDMCIRQDVMNGSDFDPADVADPLSLVVRGRKSAGPASPPFSEYWMETGRIDGTRCGYLFDSTKLADGSWRVIAWYADEPAPGGRIYFPVWRFEYAVSPAGDVTERYVVAADDEVGGGPARSAYVAAWTTDGNWIGGGKPSPLAMAWSAARESAQYHDAMLGVHGLLNCRNVGLAIHDIGRDDARRWTRRLGREGGYRFHILYVETGKDRARHTFAEFTQKDVMPLHVCRGHFKTYTEDRPLFGRIVGTFWWPAHARGNAANGVVDKDYAVGGPAGGDA